MTFKDTVINVLKPFMFPADIVNVHQQPEKEAILASMGLYGEPLNKIIRRPNIFYDQVTDRFGVYLCPEKIIVDMFGGDGGPEIIVRGVFRALMCQSEYDFVLAGSSLIAQIVIGEEASKAGILAEGLMSRVSIIETNSFVTNKEDPKNMVRDRNDTSMVLALKALKEDPEIRAMVTAGSTGCALVGSCFHLGLEKGLLQPALASALPREGGGYTLLLDCGSNIDPKAKDLENYARLGSAMVRKSYGVETPRVGLLNVGKEKEKGTEVLKEAFGRIEKSAEENGFSFEGNIEGGDILTAGLDVVVCDGFTGNVIIKGFESVGLISAELAAY